MRNPIPFIVSLIFFSNLYSQKTDTRYSEKLKLETGAYGLKIVGADNNAVYFFEKKTKEGLTSGTFPKISRFNKQTLQFDIEMEYKKELKGNDFYDIKYLKDRLFLFCTTNARKDKGLIISGFEIDKKTLDPKSDLKEIASFEFDEKIEYPEKSIFSSGDSTHFIIAAPMNEDMSSIGISVIDLNLNKAANTILSLPGNSNSFNLYSIYYTKSEKILIAGSELEEVQVSKKKNNYVHKAAFVQAYDKTGKKLYAVTGNKDGNILLTAF
jgi:hypothetical protein